jgi:hypothetical protein
MTSDPSQFKQRDLTRTPGRAVRPGGGEDAPAAGPRVTDPSTKERKRPAVRGPNVGAYIEQAERAGKHVASVTINVTLTFSQPNPASAEIETSEQLRKLV